jgi:2-polyprenyl-3-methyl-5-hydroxy-6-metoxy-1,4-benzoquinol methylase
MPDQLAQWTDPPEYLDALELWLAPIRQTVFYHGLLHEYTDIARFRGFIESVEGFTAIEGKRILDSGCGSAGLMISLRQAGAGDLVGIELDSEIARLAALRTNREPGMRIIRDDAALLSLEPESFDIIMSIHVIEHVDDHEGYVQTQARLLRPGGVMLLACPNRFWPMEAHSQLPFIHYLPRRTAKALGRAMERTRFLPQVLRDRGRTATLYEHDLTFFNLRPLLRKNGFEILVMNHPAYLIGDLAIGWLHPLAVAVDLLPAALAWPLAAVAPKNINAICRKSV